MDGKNLELIAHNFRNNYECCVNSFGEVWLSDNDDDGNQQTRICHVMPGGNYGYWPRGPGQTHWHEEQPGVVPKTLRTGFGSPTGICFYEGTLLPEKYRGQLLHTDAGPRELRCFHIKSKGAGYELEKENLLTSTDNWFRPSDVCVAPDGSVFVCDWYDPGVGGHGMGDWTRGRVYRVTPKGHQGYKVPEVKLDTKEGVLTAIATPCRATRAWVAGRLAAPGASGMPKWDGVNDPLVRSRLAWMTQQHLRTQDDKYAALPAVLCLDGPDPRLRQQAVRMFREFPNTGRTDGLAKGGFADAARQVPALRREFALWLRDWPADATIVSLFYTLAEIYDGKDHFYRAALNIACGTDPKRRDAILADFDKHFPEWNDAVADLVWELRPKSVLPRLTKLLADGKLTAAQKGRIVDILAVNDDPTAGKTLLALLSADQPAEVKARALENLRLFLPTKWKELAKSDELHNSIARLLDDPKARVTGLRLVAAVRYEPALEAVAWLAADPKAPLDARRQAVQTLGEFKSQQAIKALDLFTRNEDLRAEAVRALGKVRTDASLTPLQAIVRDDKLPLDLRREAVAALAASPPGTRWLLAEHKARALPAALVADAGRLLRNSPFQGERNKALQLFPAPRKIDLAKLPAIAELAKRKGNADRGREIMAKSLNGEAQCLKCHTVRGTGGQIGPDLSLIGKKGSRENLFESILQPSKAIADQFVTWRVDTEDGQSVTGLLVQETPTALTVRDANGKDHKLPAKGSEKKKQPLSMMPDNLAATLTEDELVDLVEYLMTLQTP
jgi:putative heme-binding domain-containing protein